jgi:AbiV family abortive infection protein
MTGAELDNLSKSALRAGMRECLQSAADHQRAADELYSRKLEGIAMAHLVLASEEAAKGLVLWMQYSGAQLPHSSHRVFDAHWYKHDVGKGVSKHIVRTMKGLFEHFGLDELRQWGATEEHLKTRAHAIGELKKLKAETVSDWWIEANQTRNSGFYVDGAGGKWYRVKKVQRRTFTKRFAFVGALIGYLHMSIEISRSPKSFQ